MIRRVAPTRGEAVVVTSARGESRVTFSRTAVWPLIERHHLVDIGLHAITAELIGRQSVVCRNSVRADLKATLSLRLAKTSEDVFRAVMTLGVWGVSDAAALERTFRPKLIEALHHAARAAEFEELYVQQDSFREAIIEAMGQDLHRFQVVDVALDFFEQTPQEQLDPDHLIDAVALTTLQGAANSGALAEQRLRYEQLIAAATAELEDKEAQLKTAQDRSGLDSEAAREARRALFGTDPNDNA